jgi:hypothetical protein
MTGLIAVMGGASGRAGKTARAGQSRAALDAELMIACGSVRIIIIQRSFRDAEIPPEG